MKVLFLALILISPVIIVGYHFGYGTALEQFISDTFERFARALLGMV
jgi:hypothetical protein